MQVSELKERSAALLNRMDRLLDLTKKARSKEAKLKIKWERMQDELGSLMQRKQMELMQNPEITQRINPVTETRDPDFIQDYIRYSVEQDDEYQAKMEEFYDLQKDYYLANVDHSELAEELGTLKSQVRLLSALILYASEEGGTE